MGRKYPRKICERFVDKDLWTDGQCVGDRCEKCTKSGRAPEENLVGLAGEQAFSSL